MHPACTLLIKKSLSRLSGFDLCRGAGGPVKMGLFVFRRFFIQLEANLCVEANFRTRSTTTVKKQKSAVSGNSLHWIFLLNFSSGFFPLSPGFLCNLVRKSPQTMEKIARFPGGEKSELFAMGPVQFSWPRGVAESSFTKQGFGDNFVDFSQEITAKHRVH